MKNEQAVLHRWTGSSVFSELHIKHLRYLQNLEKNTQMIY